MMAPAEAAAVSPLGAAVPVDAAAGDRLASAAPVADYITLLKPRVMSLVVFTGLVGMAVAPG